MRIYFLLILLLYACDGQERELNKISREAGIDLRKYLNQDDTLNYIQRFPRIRFSFGPEDEKMFDRQDSMLNTLPEANLDLVKLYYYNLIVDSLLQHQPQIGNKQADETATSYKISGGLTAASNATSSLALIKSNQPFSFFLGKNNSLRFSFGQNPVFISAIGLSLVSSSAVSMMGHNRGPDDEITDSALIEGIKASFHYYQYLFEIKYDLKSLIDNTVYMARILHEQGKITIGTRIQEQYFIDYLTIREKITPLEKNHYQSFLLNFEKKLPEKFEFTDQDTYEQLVATRSTIASGLPSVEASIKSLDSKNDTIAYFKNKVLSLTTKLQEKSYAVPLEKLFFRF